ncbi:creatininase family protein [Ureibacillus acetophenoni]
MQKFLQNVTAIIGTNFRVGDSATLDEFPGTITIKPESFKNYMWDTLKSLERWGFKDFLFINTHVGNFQSLTNYHQTYREIPEFVVTS